MMNQSEFQEITCKLLKVQQKVSIQGVIGFGFASHWVKNWLEIFKLLESFKNCSNKFCSDWQVINYLHNIFSCF